MPTGLTTPLAFRRLTRVFVTSATRRHHRAYLAPPSTTTSYTVLIDNRRRASPWTRRTVDKTFRTYRHNAACARLRAFFFISFSAAKPASACERMALIKRHGQQRTLPRLPTPLLNWCYIVALPTPYRLLTRSMPVPFFSHLSALPPPSAAATPMLHTRLFATCYHGDVK